ncbi:Putative ribonuclease H protein At1g65750 [Linum perenne]
MVRESDVMMTGARSAIRNGRDTKFWTSRWVDSGIRLLDFAVDADTEPNLGEPVANFLNLDGQWDIERLRSALPSDAVDAVVGMSTPREDWGEDCLVWGREANGRFSIKSAYSLVRNEPANSDSGSWRQVWKWRGPNRIRFFLWLAIQDRIMTNANRVRRRLSADASCSFCHNSEERDLVTWLRQGLHSDNGLLFGVHCWMLWKMRNERIFSEADNYHLGAALRSIS